jgi:SNF2 family DNA or RNA helicase
LYIDIQLVLKRVQRLVNTKALAVIVTYEGVRLHKASLCSIEWSAVCLDEGHKIRNPQAEVYSLPYIYQVTYRM